MCGWGWFRSFTNGSNLAFASDWIDFHLKHLFSVFLLFLSPFMLIYDVVETPDPQSKGKILTITIWVGIDPVSTNRCTQYEEPSTWSSLLWLRNTTLRLVGSVISV